jgi:hypothetical protein
MEYTMTEIAAIPGIAIDTAPLRLLRACRAIGDSGCVERGQ